MGLSFLDNVLIRKRWLMHLFIMIFALIVVVVSAIAAKESFTAEDSISLFILLIIQMELFMAVALKIFRDVEPGFERREITRILLSRFVLFTIICFIVALVIVLLLVIIRSLMHGEDTIAGLSDFFSLEFKGWVKGTLGGLLFGAAIFIFVQWQDALKREQKLREENLIFQNETLRSQVNPHFLFNSLNTLSSLIVTRPELAESFIGKLSSIYRYIIEKGSLERVRIGEEIDFITDYFFLFQIRDGEKIRLEIEIDPSPGMFILPVSLQILVENAIKHNRATLDNPLFIKIYLDNEYVAVKNNLQRMASGIKSTGIGLKNLSERIRLTTGKKILIEETNDYYLVRMPLL
jgi:sensor histidine kinase YesM